MNNRKLVAAVGITLLQVVAIALAVGVVGAGLWGAFWVADTYPWIIWVIVYGGFLSIGVASNYKSSSWLKSRYGKD